jgi:hypothetical protein
MSEGILGQDVITEFLVVDTRVREVLGLLPDWQKKQEAMIRLREAFPGAFKGTPLEGWEPLVLPVVLGSQQAPSLGSSVNPEPEDLQAKRADGTEWTRIHGVRSVNRHTAKLAEAALERVRHPIHALELEAMLRADGWPGFSYLTDPSPEEVRWTLYRVLQSRPNTFALRGKNGRWGLVEWPKEDGM